MLRTLRIAAALSLVLTAVVMWYPAHQIGVLRLVSPWVQAVFFSFNAILVCVAEGARPDRYPLNAAPRSFLRTIRNHWIRQICIVGALLVIYAGILELGQALTSERRATMTDFAENSASVVGTMVCVYLLIYFFLRDRQLHKFVSAYFGRDLQGLTAELEYFELLESARAEALRITRGPDLPAVKVAAITALLSKALGAKTPLHEEDFLIIVYGQRNPLAHAAAPTLPVSPQS